MKFAEPAAEPGYAARGPGERPVGVEALPGEESAGAGASDGAGGSDEPRVRRDDRPVVRRDGMDGFPEPLQPFPVHPGTDGPPLTELLAMALSQEVWESFSRGSAIRRAGRAGFARNVCVALGNGGSEGAVPVLADALSDAEPLVREHAAWALGRVGGAAARPALEAALSSEDHLRVRKELALALGG